MLRCHRRHWLRDALCDLLLDGAGGHSGSGDGRRRLLVVQEDLQDSTEIQSPKLIASELNNDVVLNRNGRRWDPQTIYRLLNNHTYIGEVSYQWKIYRGEQKGIVSEDV